MVGVSTTVTEGMVWASEGEVASVGVALLAILSTVMLAMSLIILMSPAE